MTPFAGGVLRLGNFRRRAFAPAFRRVGLDHLTLDDLRHTAASLAIAAGANVKDVQAMLGHASAAMTLDTYAGLFDDSLDDVADRRDAQARRAADSCGLLALSCRCLTAFPQVRPGGAGGA